MKKIQKLSSVLLTLMLLWSLFGNASAARIADNPYYDYNGSRQIKGSVNDGGAGYNVNSFSLVASTGGSVTALCVDINQGINNTRYYAHTISDIPDGNLSDSQQKLVKNIVLHSPLVGINTIGSANEDETWRATQAALWHVVEGKNFYTGATGAEANAYTYLIGLGTAGVSLPSPLADVALSVSGTPTYTMSGSDVLMHFAVNISNGNVTGAAISLNTLTGATVDSFSNSEIVVRVPATSFFTTSSVGFKLDVSAKNSLTDVFALIPQDMEGARCVLSQALITKTTIEKSACSSVNYSYKDNSSAQVTIVKTASDTKLPLPGVAFTLTRNSNNTQYHSTTGADGRAVFSNLPAGGYTLSEDSNSTIEAQFNLVPNETLSYVLPFLTTTKNIENTAKPASITWAKKGIDYAGQTPHALQGAEFKLYSASDTSLASPIATAVSGADGVFKFENLYPGAGADYVIVETSAPSGYRQNTTKYNVHLVRGQNLDLRSTSGYDAYVNNIPLPITIKAYKHDFYYGTALDGAKISLYYGTPDNLGAFIAERTTSGGVAEFGTDLDLLPGTYTVKETSAPSGYHLDASSSGAKVIVSNPGGTGEATLYNYPDRGSLAVSKYVDGVLDSAGLMDGVKFTLTGPTELPSYSTTKEAVLSDGSASFTDLIPGTYTLSEVASTIPFGYTGSSDITINIANGQAATQSVSNASLPGRIEIQKSDPEDYAGCTTTDLEGAVFNIYKSGDMTTVVDTLTTNSTGYAISKDLVMGDYVVVEMTAPSANYVLNSTEMPVKVLPGDEKTIEVFNYKKHASLTINKTASDTGSPLEDAHFTLVGPSEYDPKTGPSDKTYTATTNASGVAQFTDLPPGTYLLTETDAPDGYVVSTQLSTGVSIVLAPGGTETKSYVNDAASAGLTVKKVTGSNDVHPGTAMQGVQFGLYDPANPSTKLYSADAPTDINGEAKFSNIPAGTYILKEIVQPDSHYELAFSCSGTAYPDGMTITLQKNNTSYYYTLENEPKKVAIRAYKFEAGTTTALSGAEITLYRLAGGIETEIGSLVTDSDGKVEFTGLWPGDYRLRETAPPFGYTLTGSPYVDVSLYEGGTDNFANAAANAAFRNEAVRGSLIVTKIVDTHTDETLNGVTFELTGPAGVSHIPSATYTAVVSGGTAVFNNLYPGTYTLHEVSNSVNAAYILGSDRTVTIPMSSQAAPAVKYETVNNTSREGSIELIKHDKDFTSVDPAGRLQNAGFQLYSMPGNIAVGGVVYTGADGKITWTGLAHGQYKVVEVSAPTGYVISAEASAGVDVTLDPAENEHITVANAKQLGSLKVHKVSSLNSGLSLAGAVFDLYAGTKDAGESPIMTKTTDSTGYAEFTGLYPGAYTLVETNAPPKYSMEAASSLGIAVTVNPGAETPLTVKNTPNNATAIVNKVSMVNTSLKLAGATFSIYKDSVAAANLKGTDVTDADGKIIFTGLVPGYYILVEETAPAGYVAAPNQEFTLEPGDALTFTFQDPEVPKGSLTITKDIVGDSGTSAVFTFKIYDSTGTVVKDNIQITGEGSTTIDGLTPGNYTVEEVSASIPAGFVLTSSNNVAATVVSSGTATATFINTSIGSLSVHKVTGDHDPVPGTPMQGVEFGLYRSGYADPISRATTDASGNASFTGIPTGDYILKEITQANPDYELTFTEGGTSYPDGKTVTVTTNSSVSYTVKNEPKKVSMHVYKYETGTAIPLKDARFELFRVNKDSSETSVGTAYTDASGKVEFTNLWPGNYILRETAAPAGYAVSTGSAAGISVSLALGDYNKELQPVYNSKLPGTLSIHKISSLDGSSLAGAAFYLYAGTVEPGETPYALMTTNSLGYAELNNIYPGTYTLVEISAPTGYIKDVTASAGISVLIEAGKTTPQTISNTPNTATAIVLKVSQDTGARLASARFALYKDSVATAGFIARGTTDANGNIVFPSLVPGNYILVEEAAPAGYNTVGNTSFTLNPGDVMTVRIADPRIPVNTPTPTPPTRVTNTPVPTPTATPTPIPSQPVISIPVTEPPYGPATGEGTGLLIAAAVLLLIGAALLVIRRKLILRR